ncbi:MAG: hypothetical protein H7A45_18785 [Verrucomicrobiales bacterium]|nr:hypothetical protein [Verrucomicrobiales bacterium]MCP5525766.1 hypothetical protein [Verrucomicrobiales bacterium]
MKPPLVVTAVSGCVLLGFSAVALLNLQTLSDLHVQEGALRAVHEGNLVANEGRQLEPPPETEPLEPLNKEEQSELIRLRREQTELNRRAGELAGIEQQHAQLSRQLATARANPGSLSAVVPPGYILRSKARNAGQGTPEAAIETWFWAVEHRNRETLVNVFLEEHASHLMDQLQREGEEEFWKGMVFFPGYEITAREPQADGSVRLELAVVPGSADSGVGGGPPPWSVTMHQVNGIWRLDPQ